MRCETVKEFITIINIGFWAELLEPISKLKILRWDEARAFRKAQFTRSMSLRDPAFEKGDNEV